MLQALDYPPTDPVKHFSGADWSLKVNVKGLSPKALQSPYTYTDLQVQASPTHQLFRILETTSPYLLLTEMRYAYEISIKSVLITMVVTSDVKH